jgi:DNA-binding CsgD family transcriptional regulator
VGQERLSILLSALSDKDRDIVLLRVEGFDNFEIAERLGYASSRVVANRLRIIRAKMVEEFGEDGKELF